MPDNLQRFALLTPRLQRSTAIADIVRYSRVQTLLLLTVCGAFVVLSLSSGSNDGGARSGGLRGPSPAWQGGKAPRGMLSKGRSDSDVAQETSLISGHARANVNFPPSWQTTTSGFGRLGRPFVISLEHRTDRLSNFTRSMAEVGITNITVIPGIPHECPQLGVTVAHIAALQLCWGSHWVDSCVIMEDDFALRLPPLEAVSMIDRFHDDMQEEWDVLMMGCHLKRFAELSTKNHTLPSYVVRVASGLTSSGYVIKREYTPKLTYNLLGGLSRLKDKCSHRDALDVTWRSLQAKDGWYTMPIEARTSSMIGYQIESYSDIERRRTKYEVR